MKKILCIFSFVFLIFFVFACNNQSNGNSTKESNFLQNSNDTQENVMKEDENNVNVSCEINFLLDNEALLDENKELNDYYKNIFSIEGNPVKNTVLYVDTQTREFYKNGWINRFRIKGKNNVYNITNKKRYKVNGEDIAKTLEMAKNDGLGDVEPELDWGYNDMTLSYSFDKDISYKGKDEISLPEKDKIISYMKDNMPKIERRDSDWGITLLDYSELTTPVQYLKYNGSLNGYKIVIEIWPIYNTIANYTEYIVELSSKCDNFEEAKLIRKEILNYVDDNSILFHEDSLKTNKILGVY